MSEQMVYASRPTVRTKRAVLFRVVLEFPSNDKWFQAETLQEAAQEMADFLDDAGHQRCIIDELVQEAGADPRELIW